MKNIKSIIKPFLWMVFFAAIFNTADASQTNLEFEISQTHIKLTKKMFTSVFTQLNPQAVKKYFSEEAKISLNWDEPMDRKKLISRVGQLSKVLKAIDYQYQGFVVSKSELVARAVVTIRLKNGDTQLRKQISIIQFKGNKIYRLWELSVANNTKLKRFN